jgi:hypothetical protein
VREVVEGTLKEAMEKAVSHTVANSLKNTVEEEVCNAMEQAIQHVSGNSSELHPSSSISTNEDEKPPEEPTVIDCTEG